MPREATGELRRLAHGFAARITIKGRERKDYPLTSCRSEGEAQERCAALAGIAVRLRRAGHANRIDEFMRLGARSMGGRSWEAVLVAVDVHCGGQTRAKGGAPPCPTFGEFAKSWYTGALSKKYPDHVREKRSADRDEELFRLYVLPHVKDVRLDEFRLADAEGVMEHVPAALESGTRRHIAQVMSDTRTP